MKWAAVTLEAANLVQKEFSAINVCAPSFTHVETEAGRHGLEVTLQSCLCPPTGNSLQQEEKGQDRNGTVPACP